MRPRRALAWTALALAGSGWLAEARADVVVLEAHTGERPADADALFAPVLAELGDHLAGEAVAERIEGALSGTGRLLSEAELAEAERFIDSATSSS